MIIQVLGCIWEEREREREEGLQKSQIGYDVKTVYFDLDYVMDKVERISRCLYGKLIISCKMLFVKEMMLVIRLHKTLALCSDPTRKLH